MISQLRRDGNSEAEAPKLATISGSHSYTIVSEEIGQTYIIDVAMPPVSAANTQDLPVVYVLDANGTFGVAAQTARLLQMGPYPLPPMLIVGIGYPAQDIPRIIGLRTRDLSPSADEPYLARFRAAPPPWTFPADIMPGGARAFLAFIERDVMPFIAARYSVNAKDQTLAGLSLGGLFALHTLFSKPGLFNRYIAISPAVWWDDCILFKEEAQLASQIEDLQAN